MEAVALIVPAIASMALGGALLVPIRDNRKGRKATVRGRTPLMIAFQSARARSPDMTMPELVDAGAADESVTDAGPLLQAPAVAEPVAAIRTFMKKLRAKLPAFPELVRARDEGDGLDIVVERSFAEELAALLPLDGVALGRADMPAVATAESLVDTAVSDESRPGEDVASEACSYPSSRFLQKTSHSDRIVPLTRLPLRHAPSAISWPAAASPPLGSADDATRYAFLRSAARSKSLENDALLAHAFREETRAGRTLALAALSRTTASRAAIETFAAALDTGTDDERAIAVDALADAGARDEIACGLRDRVDAIAAKAALAYVGTTIREDYRIALAAFLDDSRIATILATLAGIVE